jgi:hypothetical protein
MSVLFYWKYEDYVSDIAQGKAFRINHSNELISTLQTGHRVWVFTRVTGMYTLAVELVVTGTQTNPSGSISGHYRVSGDPKNTRYFDINQGIDFEPIVRQIFPQIPRATRTSKFLGLSSFFEGPNSARSIDGAAEQTLVDFAKDLRTI